MFLFFGVFDRKGWIVLLLAFSRWVDEWIVMLFGCLFVDCLSVDNELKGNREETDFF